MTEFDNLNISLEEGILTITVNRISKLNALNTDTVQEIGTAMQEAFDNDEVKGIIFTYKAITRLITGRY